MAVSLRSRRARLGVDRRFVKIYIATFIGYLLTTYCAVLSNISPDVIAAFVNMSNGYSVTMVYPFLSATTKFFLPDTDTASINTYAGFIVAAFFAGRILGSYIWGALADHFGRKPVIAVSISLMAACTLALAFSVNYEMVVVFRALLGLSNGVLVVIRAVISESSTDANQTFGFSMLTCSWLLSAVAGPLLSGLTADPITQYNLTLSDGAVKSFLTRFPYSPPYLLNSLVCAVGAAAMIFLLPETLVKKSKQKQVLSIVDPGLHSQMQELTPVNGVDESSIANGAPNATDNVPSQEEHSVKDEEDSGDQSHLMAETTNGHPHASNHFQWDSETCVTKMKSVVARAAADVRLWLADMKSLLWSRTVLMIFSAHCIFAVFDTGSDSLFALWCATPLSLGGLDFKVNEIGITSTVISAISCPFNLFLYPLLAKRFSSLHAHQLFAVVFLVLILLAPNIHYLALIGQTAAVWVLLIACRVALVTSTCTCFAAQCLFICNSVSNEKLGRINGMAVFISDIFRSTSPALTGVLYAASLSQQSMSIGFPVNFYLTFIFFSGSALAMVLIMACSPSNINYKKA